MWCFNCENEVEINSTTQFCPVCGADIALDVRNQLAAEECVCNLITVEDRSKIEDMLLVGDGVEAMHLVRMIRGKRDPLVENRVLRIIENTPFRTKMVVCPHCLSEIDNPGRGGRLCPICYKDIAISADEYKQAEILLDTHISIDSRRAIEHLLRDNKKIEALHLVQTITKESNRSVILAVIKIAAQNTINGDVIDCWRTTDTRSEKPIRLSLCAACNKQISTQAESCPHCGHPTGVHVCPKCNSTNTKVISGSSKAASIFLWGPFAANKVLSKFQCKDCGHKW